MKCPICHQHFLWDEVEEHEKLHRKGMDCWREYIESLAEMDKTEIELAKELANYLTRQFIGNPKGLPDDESLVEAYHILYLAKRAGWIDPNISITEGTK